MKLLIVEDERALRDSLVSFLSDEGFLCEEAEDYDSALQKMLVYDYDLIILDLNLPGGNGLDLLSSLKNEKPDSGVLILTAKDSLDDKIKGLDLGSDDYITKPFHLPELNSRINAIIRRKNFKGSDSIKFNELEITPSKRLVTVHNNEIDLTKKEFDLLLYLIINKNLVLTKEAIAEHLWGDNIDIVDNFDFIYTHIKNLRQKIEKQKGKDYLKTVYGFGYKFDEFI